MLLTRSIGSASNFRAWVKLQNKTTGNGSVPQSGYLPNIFGFTRDVSVVSRLYVNGILKNSSTNSVFNSNLTNGIARIGYAINYNYFTIVQMQCILKLYGILFSVVLVISNYIRQDAKIHDPFRSRIHFPTKC